MSSSSDEDLPLIRRQVAESVRNKSRATAMVLNDSSDSSLPSWMEQQRKRQVASPLKGARRDMMIFIDSSDSESNVTESKMNGKDGKETQSAEMNKSALEVGKKEEDFDQPSTVVLTQPSQTTQQTHDDKYKAKLDKRQPLNAVTDSTTVPVVVPDKLPPRKVLMELESNDAIAGTTDLSGDTGAIGRFLVRKVASEDGQISLECMELDLKGSIYSVTPVQYPGTLMILNFNGSEAKVESITDTFVQLREDKRFSNEEDAEKLKRWLDDDDDDDLTLPSQTGKLGGQGSRVGKKALGAKKRTLNVSGAKKSTGGVAKTAAKRKPAGGRSKKKT